MAELGEIGFETFTEESYGLNAYIIQKICFRKKPLTKS